jgi:hypothetical protein
MKNYTQYSDGIEGCSKQKYHSMQQDAQCSRMCFQGFDYTTPNLFFSFTMQDYQQSYLHCPISSQQENRIPFHFICPEVLQNFG